MLENLLKAYDVFNEKMEVDLQGWGTNEATLNAFIDELKPELIIEVGTWKGQSAINMARHIVETGLKCRILCVDTWLGSLEHVDTMSTRNGYPIVYQQFLYNVKSLGLTDIIIPFPITSSIGARWLLANGIKSKMIYIDGSHDTEDVYNDVKNYYKLVDGGGVLLGDDYAWDSVRNGVRLFTDDVELFNDGVVWVIRK